MDGHEKGACPRYIYIKVYREQEACRPTWGSGTGIRPLTGMTILNTIFGHPTRDEELARRVREGDTAAAEQLYRQHARYLTAVCSRYLANDEDVRDVLQEVFLKAFSSIGRFQPRGEGSLRAWLARIACNECISHLKASSRLTFTDLGEDCTQLPCEEPEVEGVPAQVLQSLVRELPEGYRVVLNLYVMEGKSHREIAHMLGIKTGTSASQLHKAKRALAASIKQYLRDNHT